MHPHVLIVSVAEDAPAQRVAHELSRRGAQVSWFDAAAFPSTARIHAEFQTTGEALRLEQPQETIDLASLQAVLYRKPGRPAVPAISDAGVREMCESESADFLTSVWDAIGCRTVPAPPSVMTRSQRKAPQLRLARALGLRVPPTLFTNDPRQFLDFYRRHNGRIVSKITGTINLKRYAGEQFARYTERVSTRDIAHAKAIELCPMILQAYVPKRLELRILVVGQRVFAAEIHSQASNRTAHDWRRYDLDMTPHRPHQLPESIARLCCELTRRLDLLYGAIDMILTPDGDYVFLEINPNGEYGWIEDLTGLPISAAIAEELLAITTVQRRAGAPQRMQADYA
jgi:glutathione synthase/RimK-type ligase-like ATP-grasp enzyme